MVDEGKGWWREHPEHALAAKGISLGRDKPQAARIARQPETEETDEVPLKDVLAKSTVKTTKKPQVIIPEQRVDIPPERLDEVIGATSSEKEYEGQEVFGIKIDSPETAFADFFGGLGESFVLGSGEAGEAVGSAIFPTDKTAGDVIEGKIELGRKGETLNVAEETFGGQKLDDQFEDMAKTKIELNYMETPEDEMDAEALAQKERELAGLAPTFRTGEFVGEKVGAGVGAAGKKIGTALEWAKEKFRREKGREPLPHEEDRMAEEIVAQMAEEEVQVPPTQPAVAPGAPIPEVAKPIPELAPTAPPPETAISEEEAQAIVEELERQKILRENNRQGGL